MNHLDHDMPSVPVGAKVNAQRREGGKTRRAADLDPTGTLDTLWTCKIPGFLSEGDSRNPGFFVTATLATGPPPACDHSGWLIGGLFPYASEPPASYTTAEGTNQPA